MGVEIDRIDRAILKSLREDRRMASADLADKMNVSPATCRRRLRRLLSRGVIFDFRPNLNRQTAGRRATALVGVVLDKATPERVTAFEAAIAKLPFVLNCQRATAYFDCLVKVRVCDVSDYNRLHRGKLLALPAVKQLQSVFVPSDVIDDAPWELEGAD